MAHVHADTSFDVFNALMQKSLTQALAWGDGKLYRAEQQTPLGAFSDVYLNSFHDPERRQYHNCSACKSFLNHYGGLMVIKDGQHRSALFGFLNDVPDEFKAAARNLQKVVELRGPYSAFYASEAVLGTPDAGGWTHFWFKNPKPYTARLLSPGQAMAKSREDAIVLVKALLDFDQKTFARVAFLADTNALPRAELFRDKTKAYAALCAGKPDFSLVLAALTNTPSLTGLKSSALGQLYADLDGGMPEKDALNRFKATVDPQVYQQPTAAPKAGQIEQAEKIFERLSLEPALHRRVLTHSDIAHRVVWRAGQYGHQQAKAPSGVFAGLKGSTPFTPGTTVQSSLKNFCVNLAQQLSSLQLIELHRPHSLGFLTGPTITGAPPLYRWGQEAWLRMYDAKAHTFGLSEQGAEVVSFLDLPSTWDGNSDLQGMLFTLRDARPDDATLQLVGAGITAEGLRSELHGVRHVVVAHSAKQSLDISPGAAAGLIIRKDAFKPFKLAGTGVAGGVIVHITSWE